MIRQSRGHGWRSESITFSFPVPASQRPDTPAEVVAVVAEKAHRFMHRPALAETQGSPDLAAVAQTLGEVATLHQRGVD